MTTTLHEIDAYGQEGIDTLRQMDPETRQRKLATIMLNIAKKAVPTPHELFGIFMHAATQGVIEAHPTATLSDVYLQLAANFQTSATDEHKLAKMKDRHDSIFGGDVPI